MPLVGMHTCLLWWAESLFDLGLDLCCAVLHEDCAVGITLGHLLLALSEQHSSMLAQLSEGVPVIQNPHARTHTKLLAARNAGQCSDAYNADYCSP